MFTAIVNMDEDVLEAAAKLVPKAFLATSRDAQESRTKVFRILLEQVITSTPSKVPSLTSP